MIDHGHWTCVLGRSRQHNSPVSKAKATSLATSLLSHTNTNPFHVLSEPDQRQLQKLILPDGTIVYSEHSSVQQLFRSLRSMINEICNKTATTKKISSRNVNSIQDNPAEPQKNTSLIARVREHTKTSTFKKNKRNKHKKPKPKNNDDNDELTVEFAQTLQQSANAGVPLTILSKPKKISKSATSSPPETDHKHQLMLFTNEIYSFVLQHFSDVDVKNLECFESLKA